MTKLPSIEKLEKMETDDLKKYGGGAIFVMFFSASVTVFYLISLVLFASAVFMNFFNLGAAVMATYLILSNNFDIMYHNIKLYSMIYKILEKRGVF